MKDIDFDSIGKKLKEIRTHKGFTQKFVASSVKVNTSHISNIENGKIKSPLPHLLMYAMFDVLLCYVLKN